MDAALPQLSRFELRRQLGQGGMGRVYEAYDRDTHAVVALKALRDLNPDALFRFKNEFRALADLQHPNLVRFGELYCEGDQWFFTMELVRGSNFQRWVRLAVPARGRGGDDDVDTAVRTGVMPPSWGDDPSATLLEGPGEVESVRGYDEARLRDALRQLVLAIDALHRSGRVHRDIKPSNVLVRDDGHLVLLDFGLVEELRSAARGVVGPSHTMSGTPAFMAPEQVLDGHVTAAADWYGLGTMLFMALTGRVPFGGFPHEMIDAKRLREAPEARALCLDVPDDLNELCRALLARDPEARPSAAAILRLVGATADAAVADSDAAAAETPAVFIGRARELAVLGEALAASGPGATVPLLVEGEPGVGKSALVRHFLERAQAADPRLVVLAGRCYEQEALPFKAFDAVIDALALHLGALPEAEAAALLRDDVRYLPSLFPVLRRVAAIAAQATPREIDNPLALRARAFTELKRLLAALAARVRLVLFIDDLQWADKDSLALLDHLLEPPDAPGGLLVAARRASSDGHASVAGEHKRWLRFRRLPLAGLSRGEAEVLWAELGGAVGRDTVLDEAGGHPLFLSELVRFWKTRGDGSAPAGSNRLQDVIWERIRNLGPAERRFMECVALAGAPMKFQVLARAAEIADGESLQLMSALRIAQMIRVDRRGETRLVEPYHDRVREAIVPRLGDEAAQLHLALGRSLLDDSAGHDSELDEALFTIVRHFVRGAALIADSAERQRVAALGLRAAQRAKLATAYEAALGYAGDADALLGGDESTPAHAIRFALDQERIELEYLLDRPALASAHFETAMASARDVRERAQLYVLRVDMLKLRGESKAAIAYGCTALRELGVTFAEHPGRLAIVRELALLQLLRGWRSLLQLAELPETRDERIRAAMQLLVAMTPAAFFVDRTVLMAVLLRIASMSLRHGVTENSAYGFVGYGLVLTGGFGQYRRGFELGQLAVRLNERFGGGALEARIHYMAGAFLTPWVRPFAESLAQLRRAEVAAQRTGDMAYWLRAAGSASLTLELCAGQTSEIIAMARTAVERGRDQRDFDMQLSNELRVRLFEALRDPTLEVSAAEEGPPSFVELAPRLANGQTPLSTTAAHSYRGTFAYLFGAYEAAAAHMIEAEATEFPLFAMTALVNRVFYRVLVAAQLLGSGSDRRHLQRWVDKGLVQLRTWARVCPDNFASRYLLARAEVSRLRKKWRHAEADYAAAAAHARAHGVTGVEALALELESRYRRAHGQSAADIRLHDAIAAYERWGAPAKASALRRTLGK